MKFKSNIESQAGIEDSSGSAGTAGQILSSLGPIAGVDGVDWIDPANIVTSATDVIIECKNTSGITIAKGTPVYQTGNVGATAVIEVAVADASDEDKMAAIGLLQSDLINNAFGYVVVTGELLNITTSPIDGVTPTIGDTIYVKPGGGLTLTKPTGVNFIQNVGLVGKVSGGNAGSLTVSSIMRSNDVPTPLYIDHDNQRLGVGETSPDVKLHVAGDDTAAAFSTVLKVESTADEGSVQDIHIYNQYDRDIGIKFETLGGENYIWQDSNSDDALIFSTGGSNRTNDAALILEQDQDVIVPNGKLGVGLSSPSTTLHVGGFTRMNGGLQMNTANATIYQIQDSALRFGTNNTERMRIDADGNVGIGTTSPSEKLDVSGSANFSTDIIVGRNATALSFDMNPAYDSGNYYLKLHKNQSNDGGVLLYSKPTSGSAQLDWQIVNQGTTGDLKFYAAGLAGNALVLDRETGSLQLPEYGAGTLVSDASGNITVSSGGGAGGPYLPLAGGTMTGNLFIEGASTPKITITDTTNNLEGRIRVANNYMYIEADNSDAVVSTRMVLKTDGVEALYLDGNQNATFAGAIAVQGTGDSYFTGNVGIGTTSPSAPLSLGNGGAESLELNHNISSSSRILSYNRSNNTYRQLQLDALEHVFKTGSSERMRINSSGEVLVGVTSNQTQSKLTSRQNGSAIEFGHLNQSGQYYGTLGAMSSSGSPFIAFSADNSTANSFTTRGAKGFVISQDTGLSGDLIFSSVPLANTANQGLVERMRIDSSGNVGIGTTSPSEKLDVVGNIELNGVLYIGSRGIYQQENTDVSGLELVANASTSLYRAAFFDYVIQKAGNVRAGTVFACNDGGSVEYTETSTNDIGDTSDVVLSVDISGGNMRLLADAATSGWSVKSLIRAI